MEHVVSLAVIGAAPEADLRTVIESSDVMDRVDQLRASGELCRSLWEEFVGQLPRLLEEQKANKICPDSTTVLALPMHDDAMLIVEVSSNSDEIYIHRAVMAHKIFAQGT